MHTDNFDMLEPAIDVNTTNTPITFTQDTPENRHKKCIQELSKILEKGYTVESGNQLIEYVQKQRALLIDVIVENFLMKPNPKMADAVNTLLAQMEKSVRDDRKEVLKGKELETSRETFELFSRSLSAVVEGHINMPTFESRSLILDPMNSTPSGETFEFTEGEYITGHQVIDTKEIERQLEEAAVSSDGMGELE